ncbi:MAG: hypothetical protein GY790_15650, partial [Bacteroidetes bacterium]|nr:hypothetical protein [Bacteroidota bacterium]
MKRIISGLIFAMSIFLIQASLFSGSVSAQEGDRESINGPGVVPLETQERLRAIYEERAFSARSFRAKWIPDGSRIAFVRSDASAVRLRSYLVPGDPSYPEVDERRFARVGGTITSLRVGVVDVSGEETTWLP